MRLAGAERRSRGISWQSAGSWASRSAWRMSCRPDRLFRLASHSRLRSRMPSVPAAGSLGPAARVLW